MTWFKVDDNFCGHPKVSGLDMAARGLWVTAGSWCAQQLTDGEINDRQIRQLGGTRKQADKLVTAGLWTHDGASLSARRYFFKNWSDFQPTRDEVESKRRQARERMAEARAKREQASRNAEKFARTNTERSQNVRSTQNFAKRSPYPDPTRPDPTRPDHISKKDVASQSTTSTARDDDWLAAEFPNLADDVAAAARRADTTGIDRDAIRTGIREYASRPQPKAPGLLRTIINDAAEKASEDTRRREQARARRTVINNCTLCDEHGIVRVPGGRTRCPHDQEQLAQLHAQAQADVDARAQAEQERAEKANSPETVQGRWRRKREATTHILDPDTPLPPRTHIIDAEPAQKHTETGHTATNTPPPGTHPNKWKQTPQNPQNKDTT